MNRHKSVREDDSVLRQLLHHDFQKAQCDGYTESTKVLGSDLAMPQAQYEFDVRLSL
jgi:hypothetical protein